MLKLKKPEFEWYVLRAFGNRDRWLRGEEKEPCEAEIRIPTYADTRELQRQIDPQTGKLTDEQNADHFARHVRGIKGMEFEGVPITSGSELIKLRKEMPSDIISELFVAINSAGMLEEGLRRNLGSPRSLAGSGPMNAGTAEAAGPAA